MLLGIIFYLSSLVFGALLADYFFSKYVSQRLILFAMGVPIGFALAAYCTLFFEILFGSFHWWLVALASLLMLAISFYLCLHLRWRRKGLAEFRKELRDHRLLYCGILLISLVLMLMQYQGLRATAGGVSAADNYGVDFLFHLGIGNSLIYGPFPPQFPYAAGAANVYPFIPDFYSALLVYSGLGLVMPFYLMNFLLYFSLVAIGSYLFFQAVEKPVAAPVRDVHIHILRRGAEPHRDGRVQCAAVRIPDPDLQPAVQQLQQPLLSHNVPLF